ncbi:MAG: DsbE family thiol:disulfide interchange protein [Alphaproteobacteria bacterium]
MRRLAFFLPVLLFLGVAGYLLVGLWLEPQRLPSALIDRPAPDFALPPLEGRSAPGAENGFGTADLQSGRTSLVNVFASWCLPCRAEHPILVDLSETTGVPIYGINYKDDPATAAKWLHDLGDPFAAVGADQDGRVAIDWGVYGVPETFVVDGAGTIRYRYAGPLTPEIVRRELLPALKAARAGDAG